MKRIVEASTPSVTEIHKEIAETRLTSYLKSDDQALNGVNNEVLKKIHEGIISTALEERGWNLEKEKDGIKLYRKDYKDNALIIFKIETTVKCSMKTMQKALNGMYWTKLMPLLKSLETIERYDNEHADWYQVLDLPFPFSKRDCVYSQWTKFGDQTSNSLLYAIERSDTPPVKGCVRQDWTCSYRADAVDEDPLCLKYSSYYSQVGYVNKWAMASMNKMAMNTMREFKTMLEEEECGK